MTYNFNHVNKTSSNAFYWKRDKHYTKTWNWPPIFFFNFWPQIKKWRSIFFTEYCLGQKPSLNWKWAKSKLWQVVILWCLTSTYIGPQWGQFLNPKPWKCVVNLPLVLWNMHEKFQPFMTKIVDFLG